MELEANIDEAVALTLRPMRTSEGFSGKTALVTGAAGGMGLEASRRLGAEDVRVYGVDTRAPDAGGTPAGAVFETGDAGDEGLMSALAARAVEETGRLDYLVNAAGVLWFDRDTSFASVDPEVWDEVLRNNLTAAMIAARVVVPHMRRGGAMVHVSSTQCYRGDPRPQDAYQASKAGLLALSRSIAIQFAADGVRSNVVVPGPTRSPMQRRWEANPAAEQSTAASIPLGRVGTTGDLAEAILFLLSDRASWITGTELIVDGGRLARP